MARIKIGTQVSANTQEVTLLPITIDPIPDTILDYDDGDNQYTLYVNRSYSATGNCLIPGLAEPLAMRMKFVRTDTGREISLPAVINPDGTCSVKVKFPSQGTWTTTTDILNSDLPEPMFSIETQTIEVI